MTDEPMALQFHGEIKKILDRELEANNSIAETWRGNWPYKNVSAIFLRFPFKTTIQKGLDGIVFRNVNDPHY